MKILCCSSDDLPEIETALGDLRFEEPQSIPAWSGVWEANNPHTCLQVELVSLRPTNRTFGQEDCLYLNIYIPEEVLLQPKNLDVLVVIHGGAFMVGSGHMAINSTIMMDKDIVLVSMNYRVGILGFLSTEDDAIPGNNGMKDQVLALKWVKDNIGAFGRNPNSVTIVGMSAGGAAVHLQYFSPLTKGLFVRGMSQSGTALAPWVVRKNALQKAKKLGALVGCPDSPSKDLKVCLKQRPAENLLQQLKHFFGFATFLPFSPFAPVVEKKSRSAFLDQEPFQLLKEGKVLDVPWITSYTSEEGLLPTAFLLPNLDEIDQQWLDISKYILDYNDTLSTSNGEKVAKQILDFYLGSDAKINEQNLTLNTGILINMCTDRLFRIPAEVAAKIQSKVNSSPVYFYLFNYQGENGLAKYYSTQKLEGTAHGDDGVFFYGIFSEGPFPEQDARLRVACQDMLYSFASSGKPSFDGTDTWQPTTPKELVYINVTGSDNFRLQRTKELAPSDFWNKLGLLENENSIKDEL